MSTWETVAVMVASVGGGMGMMFLFLWACKKAGLW